MTFSTKIAALFLRLTLGSILLAHGLLMLGVLHGGQTEVAAAVAVGNQHGIGEAYRIAATAIQTLGGMMLILGLGGRFAATAVVALMVFRVLFASTPYFFASDGGFEVPLALGAMALAVLFLGSGMASVDSQLSDRKQRGRSPAGGGSAPSTPEPQTPTSMPTSE